MSEMYPLSGLPSTLELNFFQGGDPEISANLETWIHDLQQGSSGKIICKRNTPGNRAHLPSLEIPGGRGSIIAYHFMPQGPEEEAFRELLWQKTQQEGEEKTDAQEQEPPPDPIEIFLFVANQCPNCPKAVRTIHTLALSPNGPALDTHLFEATKSPALVERYQVKSVPTLLIQKQFRFVGTPDPEKLSTLLQSGSSSEFLQEQIRQQVEGGEAPEAGKKISGMEDSMFLLEDLRNSTFQSRIGWLLALEEALEMKPTCLDPLVEGILSLLEGADTSLRGDLADLLGKIGRPEALPGLEGLCRDQNPDVVEAAKDAIEEIQSKL